MLSYEFLVVYTRGFRQERGVELVNYSSSKNYLVVRITSVAKYMFLLILLLAKYTLTKYNYTTSSYYYGKSEEKRK